MTTTAPPRSQPDDPSGPDPEDLEAVYLAHGRRCYSLALRVVRDRHLAQDVVQDVFESLHRQPERFDPARASLLAWLTMMTHRRAVDLIRRHQVRAGRDTSLDHHTTLPDTGPTPADAVCFDDECVRLHAALLKLRPVERQVIGLAYYDGQSQSAIAALLDIPLGTVKSRTSTGLHHLRDFLDAAPGT
jgi:RNA polymerase sigma-70 factor (ECF subfamily)